MVQRLRNRAQGQEGFTLIELLVVVLIIGILAAVAIPVFLNQTGKANDANVKSDINSAATTEETFYTDNQYYTAATSGSSTVLTTINPGLTNAFNSPTAASNPGDSLTIITSPAGSTTSSTGYTITASDKAGVSFVYADAAGVVTRTCSMTSGVNPGGCKLTTGSTTAGTW